MKDKKILYGIIIAFVFLLSIGLTYAYFSVTTTVVGDRNAIQATVGTLNILYTDGPEITANNIEPGWTETKTVKIENTGTLKAYYSLIWSSLTNEITNDELILEGTCTSDTDTCDDIPFQIVGEEEIAIGIGIDPGEEHTYVITFTFIETGSEQNYNQDKSFNGVLNVAGSNEAYTLMGMLLDSNEDPLSGVMIEIHSTLRTGVTDTNGRFEIKGIEVGTHEVTIKNSSDVTIATDTISLLSGETESINGKEITGNTNEGEVGIKVTLGESSINTISLLEWYEKCTANDTNIGCKIFTDNIVYRDDVSSPYVTASTGVDFKTKSTPTNGQGLYTNNKLEDGSNTYFRGGSYCAYPSYASEDTSGTYCTAAGGTWNSSYRTCSLNSNRATCQSSGYTYYDLKNNVTFAGHNWRIIRIDENSNIRIILADDNVSTTAFNTSYDDNAYEGYKYGTVPSTSYELAHTNTNNSTIKTFSDNWYSTNLSSYSSYLTDAGYCNDRSKTSGSGYGTNNTNYVPYTRNATDSTASPRLSISSSCSNATRDLFTTSTSSVGNKALTYPIGLITVDEARYAGMVYYGGSVAKYNFTNYLKFNSSYWTISPAFLAASWASGFDVYNYGCFSNNNLMNNTLGFRASVSLKSSTTVSSGTGTYDNPYIIE